MGSGSETLDAKQSKSVSSKSLPPEVFEIPVGPCHVPMLYRGLKSEYREIILLKSKK